MNEKLLKSKTIISIICLIVSMIAIGVSYIKYMPTIVNCIFDIDFLEGYAIYIIITRLASSVKISVVAGSVFIASIIGIVTYNILKKNININLSSPQGSLVSVKIFNLKNIKQIIQILAALAFGLAVIVNYIADVLYYIGILETRGVIIPADYIIGGRISGLVLSTLIMLGGLAVVLCWLIVAIIKLSSNNKMKKDLLIRTTAVPANVAAAVAPVVAKAAPVVAGVAQTVRKIEDVVSGEKKEEPVVTSTTTTSAQKAAEKPAEKQAEKTTTTAKSTSGVKAASSAKLAKLKEMKDKGLITDKEYKEMLKAYEAKGVTK